MSDVLIAAAVIYGVGIAVTAAVGMLFRIGTYPGDDDRYLGAQLIFLSPIWPALLVVKMQGAWRDFKRGAP